MGAVPRRKAENETGIPRIPNIPIHDAWVYFCCVACQRNNFIRIGQSLLSPLESLETSEWKCEFCDFVHAKDEPLPFEHWPQQVPQGGFPFGLPILEGILYDWRDGAARSHIGNNANITCGPHHAVQPHFRGTSGGDHLSDRWNVAGVQGRDQHDSESQADKGATSRRLPEATRRRSLARRRE